MPLMMSPVPMGQLHLSPIPISVSLSVLVINIIGSVTLLDSGPYSPLYGPTMSNTMGSYPSG